MQTIDVNNLPLLLTVAQAVSISGVSRTELYDRMAAGEVVRRKLKTATRVETESLLRFIRNLPIR